MSWSVIVRQLLVLAAAVLVLWGIWMPLLGVPIFRDKSYMDLSPTGAIILIALAIASVVVAIFRKWGGLYITGILALVLLCYTVFEIQNQKGEVSRDIKEHVANVPFKGAVQGVVKATHLRSGFFVMASGGMLIVAVPLLWPRLRFGRSRRENAPDSPSA